MTVKASDPGGKKRLPLPAAGGSHPLENGSTGKRGASPDAPGLNEGGVVVKNLIKKLVREERGQDLVEYAFLVSGIGILAYVGVNALGTALNTYYGTNLAGSAPITATPTP